MQSFLILHNMHIPTRIKKHYCFIYSKWQQIIRKPLFSRKTDFRIRYSPDFLILTRELLPHLSIKNDIHAHTYQPRSKRRK